jgi:hypothetical protein
MWDHGENGLEEKCPLVRAKNNVAVGVLLNSPLIHVFVEIIIETLTAEICCVRQNGINHPK